MKKLISIILFAICFNAWSSTTRIAVIETAENKPYTTSSQVAKRYQCSATSCVTYSNGTGAPDGHADRVTKLIARYSSTTEIYLFTGNSDTAFDWLIDNAENKNIKALNISANISSTLNFNELYSKGVYIVVSTGNSGHRNGAVNPAVSNPYVIGVGAGFNPAEAGSECFELDQDGAQIIPPYDIRCNSPVDFNLHNFDKQHWGYIAQGCMDNDGQNGNDCGTSFAAPRVSAAIGEIFSLNPSISEDELKFALDNSMCKVKGQNWARGLNLGRYSEYVPLDPVGAINLAFGGASCDQDVSLRDFYQVSSNLIDVSTPNLTIESLGCSMRTPNYVANWSSDVDTPTYTVQWKRENSPWYPLYNGSGVLTNYSGESNKVESIRVRVFDPTKNNNSNWVTKSKVSPNCRGFGGGFR